MQPQKRMRASFFVRVAVLGLAAGAAVSLVAFLLARYGPSGGSWSFRGNGAIAAYTLAPALLAAGWTALVLQRRGRAWLTLALAAGAIGALLAALDAALLPVFGPGADLTLGAFLLVALLVWTALAPLVASRLPPGAEPRRSIGAAIAGAAIWLVSLVGGLGAVGVALPAGS